MVHIICYKTFLFKDAEIVTNKFGELAEVVKQELIAESGVSVKSYPDWIKNDPLFAKAVAEGSIQETLQPVEISTAAKDNPYRKQVEEKTGWQKKTVVA